MLLLFLVISYLAGSIPFGKIAGRLRGIDIQKKGSGNIGFANAVRTMGWKIGLAVLAGDTLKGFLPVIYAAHHLAGWRLGVVGLAAIIGHVFPVWLKFKGGKGVATGLGVVLALSPLVAVAGAAVYLAAFSLFKKSGPSSITAAWSMPVTSLLFSRGYFWLFLLLAVMAVWTHRTNLKQMKDKRARR